MKLRALVVADPAPAVAAEVAERCRRLADTVVEAHDGAAALAQVRHLKPELVVLALELTAPSCETLVPEIRSAVPQVVVVGTFRELSIQQMERLGRLGIAHFVGHPIDATAIFRAAAQRFATPHRVLARREISLEVRDCAGAVVGRTINISEGGMRLVVASPIAPADSLLVDLALPDEPGRPLRTRWRVVDVDGAPPAAILARGTFERMRAPEQARLARFLDGLERAAEVPVSPAPDV